MKKFTVIMTITVLALAATACGGKGENVETEAATTGAASEAGTDKPSRVSIHVPTFKNAPTVPTMLKGNSVADAGLIIASIDPCFSCMDR